MTMDQRERNSKLEIGRAVAAELRGQDGVLGVSLVGSLAAGLGTTRSDIDVHVVVDDRSRHRTRKVLRGGTRVDIAVRPAAVMASRVSEVARRCRDPYQPLELGPEVEEVVRLLCAQTCWTTPGYAAERERVEALREPLRRALVRALLRRAASRYEDLLGFVETGDAHSALMLSAEAVLRAVHACLVARGDLYLEEKWVWQKLARAGRFPPHTARLRDLYFADPGDPCLVEMRMSAARAAFAHVIGNEARRAPFRAAAAPPVGRRRNPWNDSTLDILLAEGALDVTSNSSS